MSTEHPERRATDAMPRQFEGEALKKAAHPHPAFADMQIEAIDMDAVLPPGHVHDEHDEHFQPAAKPEQPAAEMERNRARLQITRFKGTLDDFEISQVTRVSIDDIKRGDVIQVKTIVGSIYFRIIDRIKGLSPGVGEILCECRYDLPDQWSLVHGASIILPVCTKNHVITNPDGSQRKASRTLKMATETELPEQVKNLLRETFFVEIRIHSSPQKERLRAIDILRGVSRLAARLRKP